MSTIAEMKKARKPVIWQTKYSKPYCEIITITPEMAQYAIDHKERNRVLNERRVLCLGNNIHNALWQLNGETIKFDIDGMMFDGNHRLHACATSGVSIESVVVYGLSKSAVKTVDIGRQRTAVDMAGYYDIKNAALATSAARCCLIIKSRATLLKSPLIQESINYVLEHPELQESAACGQCVAVPPSILAAITYILKYVLKEDDNADAVAAAVQKGQSDRNDCPLICFQQYSLTKRTKAIRLERRYALFGLIHAVNLYRKGKPARRVVLPSYEELDGLDLDKL